MPRLAAAGHLLLRPGHAGPGHQARPIRPAASWTAGPATTSPTGRRSPAGRRSRGAASTGPRPSPRTVSAPRCAVADGRQTGATNTRASRSSRSTSCRRTTPASDPAGRRPPCRGRAAVRPAARPGVPARRGRTGSLGRRDDERDHAVAGHDVRHQGGVVSRAVPQLAQGDRVVDLARTAVLPGPLAHPLSQLGLPLGGGTAGSLAGLGHLPQLGQVGDDRLVLRRPHRLHPTGQHPRPLGPLEEHLGVPRVGGEGQCRGRPSRVPCPTTLVCRSRLPNELCHACRSASPRAQVPQRVDRAAAPRGQLGADVAASSATPRGALPRSQHRDEPPPRAVQLAAPDADPRAVQPHGGRPPAAVPGRPARRRAARPRPAARARSAELDLGGQHDRFRPQPARPARLVAEPPRARRAASRAARGRRPAAPGQDQLGLGLAAGAAGGRRRSRAAS